MTSFQRQLNLCKFRNVIFRSNSQSMMIYGVHIPLCVSHYSTPLLL
jgi:hypothetical protein